MTPSYISEFQNGDVLSAEQLNEVASNINELIDCVKEQEESQVESLSEHYVLSAALNNHEDRISQLENEVARLRSLIENLT